nr:unnamed protein product [Spirometra erinaceieuropaei]
MVQLRDAVHSTVLAVLGGTRRQHEDRFDDNDVILNNLLAEENNLLAYVNGPNDADRSAFHHCCRLAQQSVREIQDAWWTHKAKKMQEYDECNESNKLITAIEWIYGPSTNGNAPLLSSQGSTLLPENSQILKRWAEHFRSVLNYPSSISDAATDRRSGFPALPVRNHHQ